MNKTAARSIRLLLMEVRYEQDVVQCRQRARQFAEILGFTPQNQIRLATALSEIARNAFQYAGGGKVEFLFETEPHPGVARARQSLVIIVRDTGRGIAHLPSVLDGSYHSKTGLGLGILGARRLMGSLDVESSGRGTTVTMREILPLVSVPRDPVQIQALVDEILQRAPGGPLEEMQIQNQELIRVASEAKAKEEEIRRVNEELAETNLGVLALYDELETLHQVSLLLASKLELKALIESIIEVTTQLSNAEIGAFYFWNDKESVWNLYATAGKAAEVLEGLETQTGIEFFGRNFENQGLVRLADLGCESTPCAGSQFAQAIKGRFKVASCLVAPLVSSDRKIIGAVVFASAEADRFTERSERIVASVALQAVTGIEKSRLFQEVKANSEAKDQFLAMLSHELRTPLNPVMAIVSSWHGDPRVPVDMQEEVATIARNIRLEARLIDDLLDFNRMVSGKLRFDFASIDIHAVIESVIEICRADLEAAHQALEINLAARETHLRGDVARLQQVLWNVLKNAIKFTGQDGRLTIQTSNPTENQVRILIRDNGRGIETEALQRIFGAFEQGQPQVLARYGGLGLGLAISKTFVERHGGTIAARSEGLGKGAEFVIELPLVAAESTRVESSIEPLLPSSDPKVKILLIEDHVDTLNTLARLLRKRGHTVVTAKDGKSGREAFAEEEFDLIISDLGLPDCTGLELIAEFRAERSTPAIALSGYGMESDIRNCLAAGFNHHLTKPIDFGALLQSISRLADGSLTPQISK